MFGFESSTDSSMKSFSSWNQRTQATHDQGHLKQFTNSVNNYAADLSTALEALAGVMSAPSPSSFPFSSAPAFITSQAPTQPHPQPQLQLQLEVQAQAQAFPMNWYPHPNSQVLSFPQGQQQVQAQVEAKSRPRISLAQVELSPAWVNTWTQPYIPLPCDQQEREFNDFSRDITSLRAACNHFDTAPDAHGAHGLHDIHGTPGTLNYPLSCH